MSEIIQKQQISHQYNTEGKILFTGTQQESFFISTITNKKQITYSFEIANYTTILIETQFGITHVSQILNLNEYLFCSHVTLLLLMKDVNMIIVLTSVKTTIEII